MTGMEQRKDSRLSTSQLMGVVMGQYDPAIVNELASVMEDICRGMKGNDGTPLTHQMKAALTRRMLELYDSGITAPDQLRMKVMADGIWAASIHAPASPGKAA